MTATASARALYDALSWHVRGVFATEELRRIAFSVRDLWQPAEVEARRGIARDLALDAVPSLTVDREVGYRVLAPNALPGLDDVCDIGREIVSAAADADGEHNGNKQFSRFRLAKADQRRALLRVGLDRRLLAMAASYFGVLPVITEADFYCSYATSGPWTKSQLWHCDDDASDVLKLFIYCEDVVPEDGPFQLVERSVSTRVRKAIGYRYAGRRYRVSDETMGRFVPEGNETSLIGQRGTAFVVDTTRCFHRGSRIRDPRHRRVAAMVCYAPPSALTLPRRLSGGRAPLVELASEDSTPLERAVLGMPVATKWV